MILLLLIALLFLPSNAGYSTPLRSHVADALRLKCEELPYRTVFIGTRCYVAVAEKIKFSDAPAKCSSVFSGSTVATDLPSKIFKAMMFEESQFHVDEDSSGAKQVICVQEPGYVCDKGKQSTVLPGKCFERAAKKMNFEDAQQYCKDRGMEVPQVDNDMDNQVVRGALLKDPAWIQNIYMPPGQWKRQKSFSRFSTCDRPKPRLWAGPQMKCNLALSSVIDNTGYWGNSCQKCINTVWDVICVKDAINNFTVIKKKKVRVACSGHHQWDEETGLCEWTGPKDSCFQLIDHRGRTWFMPMPYFPKQTFGETTIADLTDVADNVVKVIVRRGCMFFGYSHPQRGEHPSQDQVLVTHRTYGEHHVPCYYRGELSIVGDGLSQVSCWCDPTEATLNGHEPAPPKDYKCIEQHVYNETTQSCESEWESKYCAELITSDGRRQKLAIPNWPSNKRYDSNHWDDAAKRGENFHIQASFVTEIVVRQHCWATLYWSNNRFHRKTLPPSGYGKHTVASHYNGQLGAPHDGTHRVVCECIR